MKVHIGNLGLDKALRTESKMSEELMGTKKLEVLKKAKNTIV